MVLIDPGTTRPRLEGLGERVAGLLAAKGLDAALAAAGPRLPRTVRWAGLTGSENGERLVRRDAFDAALRAAAQAAGACLLTARVSRIDDADVARGVALRLSDGTALRARLMLDARGRHAHSHARALRRARGPATLAVAGRVAGLPVEPGIRVAATPQGWLWDACDPGFGRWIQICIDAGDLSGDLSGELPGSGPAALAARLAGFLAQPCLDGRYAGAVADGQPVARHCALTLSAPDLAPPLVPVGDAAAAIDPLSGHGLFWALSSALAAAPMVRTLLDDPGQGAGRAARFHRDRVVGTFWRQARIGRDFYRLERGLAEYPFWAARAAWPDDRPAHAAPTETRLERRVVVDGDRLAERDVLVTPRDPDGVAFVAGLPVADLLARLRDGAGSVPDPAAGWLASRGLARPPPATRPLS
ncbi:PimS2 protein [Polymorphum gilvum SL003B-26A1]|uniref:PimS2 protein n=1 Tax=Polymorphum gilvum (strain LMG 25793 / CGMCC 1.9160 / SL003B-26A1) TaxID=991905 RepID=F2J2K0_POLGS|nr:PimS2 protein [Polymorphum gilvum SL003B-26A1]